MSSRMERAVDVRDIERGVKMLFVDRKKSVGEAE